MNNLSLVQRLLAPTPKFFKIVRTAGLILGAVGGALIAVNPPLPDLVIKIAGYLVTAGAVAAVISQSTVIQPGGE